MISVGSQRTCNCKNVWISICEHSLNLHLNAFRTNGCFLFGGLIVYRGLATTSTHILLLVFEQLHTIHISFLFTPINLRGDYLLCVACRVHRLFTGEVRMFEEWFVQLTISCLVFKQ